MGAAGLRHTSEGGHGWRYYSMSVLLYCVVCSVCRNPKGDFYCKGCSRRWPVIFRIVATTGIAIITLFLVSSKGKLNFLERQDEC